MEPAFRAYNDSDYAVCEALVNNAWSFDDVFQPRALADVAKCIYTKGSVLASNDMKVVEVNGTVVGFIFGYNEMKSKQKRNFLFELSILWRLLRIKHPKKEERTTLFKALNSHEANRFRVVGRGRSEVVLFVVGEKHQGLGYGKKLLTGFLDNCRDSGVKSVIVETNKLEASPFYEKQGFTHLANFDSPLHEFATKGGQACLYEYLCENRV